MRSDLRQDALIVAGCLWTLEDRGQDFSPNFFKSKKHACQSPELDLFNFWYSYTFLCDFILPDFVCTKVNLNLREKMVLAKAVMMYNNKPKNGIIDAYEGVALEEYLAMDRIEIAAIGGITRHMSEDIVTKYLSSVLKKLSSYDDDDEPVAVEVPEVPKNTIECLGCVLGPRKEENKIECYICDRQEEPCADELLTQESIDKFIPIKVDALRGSPNPYVPFYRSEDGKDIKVNAVHRIDGIRVSQAQGIRAVKSFPLPKRRKIREYQYDFGSAGAIPLHIIKNFSRETRSNFRTVSKSWYSACKYLKDNNSRPVDVFSRVYHNNCMAMYLSQEGFTFSIPIVDYILYQLLRSHGTTFNFAHLMNIYWDKRYDATGFILMLALEVAGQRNASKYTYRRMHNLLALYHAIPRWIMSKIASKIIYCEHSLVDQFEVNVKEMFEVADGEEMSDKFICHLAIDCEQVW